MIVAYNKKQLEIAVKDIFQKFEEHQELKISYDKPFKDKTREQLGFFFGALVKSIKLFFKEQGVTYSSENIKENFYQAVSIMDESFLKHVRKFNGTEYTVPKRLSEMSIDEATLFIDRCIYLCDNSKCFCDLVLHPSIRYTWVKKIKQDDLYNMRDTTLPREDREYLEHNRKQSCIWCGRSNNSEVHHLKEVGLTGISFKSDDWLTIPLCHDCHINQLHQKGKDEFLKDMSWITKHIDLVDFCKIKYMKWRNKR